jgi:hypothetical protein
LSKAIGEHNVAAVHPEIVQRLKAQYDEVTKEILTPIKRERAGCHWLRQ